MQFRPAGRLLVGSFLQNTFFKETTGEACNIGASFAGPLLGLAETKIEPDVFAENALNPSRITVPRARFAGGRPFTVTHTAHADGGCPRSVYQQCSESGSLTLTLRFKHPR
jgi:hypothetical protein